MSVSGGRDIRLNFFVGTGLVLRLLYGTIHSG